MEYKVDGTYKGTRIILGETAVTKRFVLNTLSDLALKYGFTEVFLPSIELTEVYTNKAGEEIKGQMFEWKDKGGRDVCLRPEGTATLQLLASSLLKFKKDVKLFYTVQCWRYEQPQAGRYREFTQFGVEWLNPSNRQKAEAECKELALLMANRLGGEYNYSDSVKRGLAYYVSEGFEIECSELGAQKQVCGGGSYEEGVGFAFGVDRLLLVNAIKTQQNEILSGSATNG
jgi:histidyl-tRNA synthetase